MYVLNISHVNAIVTKLFSSEYYKTGFCSVSFALLGWHFVYQPQGVCIYGTFKTNWQWKKAMIGSGADCI